MIKKLWRMIKFLTLTTIWTVAFLGMSRAIMRLVWKFDILSIKQWKVIAEYWNNNGVISGWFDIGFFIVLIIVFVIWIWGIRRVNKIKYGRILLKPIEYFSNREIKKYENIDTHVVIKNISVGEKMTIEDVINDRIKQEKSNVAKDADALRKSISEKIIQRKEQ